MAIRYTWWWNKYHGGIYDHDIRQIVLCVSMCTAVTTILNDFSAIVLLLLCVTNYRFQLRGTCFSAISLKEANK